MPVSRTAAPRITVVGSYATGLTMKVERMPTTGETLLGRGYRVDYGGKGSNQAVGCARLGAQVSFVARIGTDAFGDMALGLYRDEGIDVTHVNEQPTHLRELGSLSWKRTADITASPLIRELMNS